MDADNLVAHQPKHLTIVNLPQTTILVVNLLMVLRKLVMFNLLGGDQVRFVDVHLKNVDHRVRQNKGSLKILVHVVGIMVAPMVTVLSQLGVNT